MVVSNARYFGYGSVVSITKVMPGAVPGGPAAGTLFAALALVVSLACERDASLQPQAMLTIATAKGIATLFTDSRTLSGRMTRQLSIEERSVKQ